MTTRAQTRVKRKSDLKFTQYQRLALETLQHRLDDPELLALMVMALTGEVGEIAQRLYKSVRDDRRAVNRADLLLEVGDCLYYLAVIAHTLGYDFGEAAEANLEKLASRAERGVLGGDGDHR